MRKKDSSVEFFKLGTNLGIRRFLVANQKFFSKKIIIEILMRSSLICFEKFFSIRLLFAEFALFCSPALFIGFVPCSDTRIVSAWFLPEKSLLLLFYAAAADSASG